MKDDTKVNVEVSKIETMDTNNETYCSWERNGKREINNLLWTFLPDDVTLGDADYIANKIYSIIDSYWDLKE